MGPIHRVIWFLIFNSICLFQRKLICSRKINVFKHHKHSTIHEPALPDWLSKGLETWDCLTCDAESSLFCAWEFRPVVHSRLWGKIKKPSENKCRNKINGVRFHSFREKYWRNSNKHLINPRWGCVLRKGTGTRASDQQNWARTSQKRFSEAGRASEVKQPYPVPACHSQSAQVPNTASQTSCWPAVMCEHGDRDWGREGPADGLSQLQGKMVNHVSLDGSHKGTSSLCALSSLRNIPCAFPLVKSPLIPRLGNSAIHENSMTRCVASRSSNKILETGSM